jgi:hypothetical protein
VTVEFSIVALTVSFRMLRAAEPLIATSLLSPSAAPSPKAKSLVVAFAVTATESATTVLWSIVASVVSARLFHASATPRVIAPANPSSNRVAPSALTSSDVLDTALTVTAPTASMTEPSVTDAVVVLSSWLYDRRIFNPLNPGSSAEYLFDPVMFALTETAPPAATPEACTSATALAVLRSNEYDELTLLAVLAVPVMSMSPSDWMLLPSVTDAVAFARAARNPPSSDRFRFWLLLPNECENV